MTAFNSDYYKRTKRRVYVLRGFDGCEPSTFTRQAAVKDGVTVGSGQVISLDSNGEWILGAPAGKTPYIALSDSVDTDVNSSGLLPALSCAGKFEIETAYYTVDSTLVGEDIPVIAATAEANAGDITDGATDGTADIIGFTSRGGLHDLNAPAENGNSGPKVEVNATDGNVVTFITNWQPLNAA